MGRKTNVLLLAASPLFLCTSSFSVFYTPLLQYIFSATSDYLCHRSESCHQGSMQERRTHAHARTHTLGLTPLSLLLYLTITNQTYTHAQQERGHRSVTCAGAPIASSPKLKPTTTPPTHKMSPLFSALPPHRRNSAQSQTRKYDPIYQNQKER